MLRLISDLHLDASRPQVAAAFTRLLDASAADGRIEGLYILGDLFEMWIGDDDDDAFNLGIVEVLRRTAQRLPVYVMHGNRDFLLGTHFAHHSGATLLAERTLLEVGGQRALLMHGDELCSDDTAYQQMRRVLRSPAWQTDILARSLEERRAIGLSMRGGSRERTSRLDPGIMDVNTAAVEATFEAHDVDLMIHGHTHRPAIHRHQRGRRIVLGDWDSCAWHLDLDAADARLTRTAL